MSLLQSVFLPLALVAGIAGDGFLGVTLQDDNGPTVASIVPGTAAAKSDLEVGDRFLAVNGKKTPDVDAFIKVVGSHDAGDRLRFDIDRLGREITLYIELGRRPDADALEEIIEEEERPEPVARMKVAEEPLRPSSRGSKDGAFLGVSVEEGDGVQGVQVVELVPDGPAMQAGLRAGDQILRLGRTGDVANMRDLQGALAALRPGQTIRVKVRRDGETETLALTLGARPMEGAAEETQERVAETRAAEEADRAKQSARRAKEEAKRAKERAERDAARARRDAEREAKRAREHAEREAKQAREHAEREAKQARARAERESKQARANAERESDGAEREMRALRKELKDLRKEIAELKKLVEKLNR